MTNEKQKIKLEDSNVLFFLIHQRENVSVLEKVSKSALSSFVLMIFFFFFYPPVLFSLCIWKRKREKAGWRKRHRELRCPPVSSVEEST